MTSSSNLDTGTLKFVFQDRPDILEGIQKAADSPARIALFNNIASFMRERLASEEPASKRRRIDVANANGHSATQTNADAAPKRTAAGVDGADMAATEPVLIEIKEISVSLPQRRKYDLCFTENFLYARAAGSAVPVQGIVYAWKDIEHVFCVPVPDKAQVQHNYVIIPRHSALPSKSPSPCDPEPLVFTVASIAPKPETIVGPSAAAAGPFSDSYRDLFDWALTSSLRAIGNQACSNVISSDPRIFAGAARQAYRPNEKAVHVKAFRGSKDGYLFFLPAGILWAFKKPLIFLPLDRIVAVSYTSVLQRTFNIVVEVDTGRGSDDGKTEEIEFAMLDQEDFQSIDETYVKRHGLQDRSMADQRKAKRQLAENAKRRVDGQAGADVGDGEDGMTALEKAQQEAQEQLDDDDDDEEDYNPGSDGESEGEGESSEEDDQSEGEGEGEADADDD